jgi:cellulose synthase/poly-beta-1,6-N-acetylglucosamine synthase-like glycosyltransferase
MIFTAIAAIALFVQLYFHYWLHSGLKKKLCQLLTPLTQPPKLSVVIAAHNEEKNIGNLLSALSAQSLSKDCFEIILVCDRCSDNTIPISEQYRTLLPNLKIFAINDVPKAISPKKYALQKAVNQATFPYFVFLDADVLPGTNHLKTFQSYFQNGYDVVVSLMRFRKPKNIWQSFLVYEKWISWCIAGASIGHTKPIISYGGNWGYSRRAFEKVGGFQEIFSSLSGDDDLLLQKFGKAALTVAFCTNPHGWVEMDYLSSLKHFLRQRRRHFSAGKKYQPAVKAGYLWYHTSNLLLWLLPFFSPFCAVFLLAKIGLDITAFRHTSSLFQLHISTPNQVLFNALYVCYNTLIGPLGHIGKIRW